MGLLSKISSHRKEEYNAGEKPPVPTPNTTDNHNCVKQDPCNGSLVRIIRNGFLLPATLRGSKEAFSLSSHRVLIDEFQLLTRTRPSYSTATTRPSHSRRAFPTIPPLVPGAVVRTPEGARAPSAAVQSLVLVRSQMAYGRGRKISGRGAGSQDPVRTHSRGCASW